MNRHGVHEASGTSLHGGEKRVQEENGEEHDGDVTWRIRHLLHRPDNNSDNNADVRRNERNAATRQLPDKEQLKQHNLPSNGCFPCRPCELCTQRNRQLATAESSDPL